MLLSSAARGDSIQVQGGVHVLALVTDAFGGYGGIARYNRDFLEALALSPLIASVTVLPRLAPDPIHALPDKIRQLAPESDVVRYSLGALRCAWHMPPRHFIFCGHILMSPLAGILRRLGGKPVWLQVHGIDAWAPPSARVAWGAHSASLVTAVSRHTRQQMLSNWWQGPESALAVLPNTVGTEFSPGPKVPGILARHGLENRKVILTVSRLSKGDRYKGQDYVIAALAGLKQDHPTAVYVIAGAATKDEQARLSAAAQAFGVADRVIFAGKVGTDELPGYLRSADVFVMPSTKEGFGIVFLEAAACGIPVIAGNRDGSVDALADGAIGTLVDPENTKQIADAIRAAFARGPATDTSAVARFSQHRFRAHAAGLVERIAEMLPGPGHA